jgi:hypothetical protein
MITSTISSTKAGKSTLSAIGSNLYAKLNAIQLRPRFPFIRSFEKLGANDSEG